MNTNYLWVEKYRPNKLDDICSQEHIINFLKSSLIVKNIPHLILFGPSGCGKTVLLQNMDMDIYIYIYVYI